MIARLVDGFFTLLFAAQTAFCFGVLGESIDRGKDLGVLMASVLIAVGIGGVYFFGRGVIRGFPSVEPPALDGEAESDRLSPLSAPRSGSADLPRRRAS